MIEKPRGAQPPLSAFRLAFSPSPGDFDELGHVNNAVYLRWAQEVAVAHWRASASDDLKRRWLWVVLRHEIDYRDPILPGDAVEGRTWLGAADGARFDRFVDIRKPGALRPSAAVRSTWVMIDAQTRKPRRIGADVFAAFGFSP
jgi:acyl-CoA thioester hydrolase